MADPQAALLLLEPDQAKAYRQLAVRVQEVTASLPDHALANQAEADALNGALIRAKEALATIERARKSATKDLRDQVRQIDDLYRPLTDALKGLKAAADPLLLAWIRAERERVEAERREAERLAREAEEREIQARLAAEETESPKVRAVAERQVAEAQQQAAFALSHAPAPVKGVAGAVGGHSVTRTWKAIVSEPAKLPREFLMPDQAAIDEALAIAVRKMRAAGRGAPDLDIPGVTLEEVEGLRRGRGR
jgi:hypothetical protein